MKVGYVSIQNAVLDWIQDNSLGQEEVDDKLLIKWAVDCLRWCSTQQQLKHRIAILQVQNSRAELPDDFEVLAQAAASVRYELPPCDCEPIDCPEDCDDCCAQKYDFIEEGECRNFDGSKDERRDRRRGGVRKAHSCCHRSTCQWSHVDNYGRLPRTRREDIVQWVQGTLEKDCHLEINLVCPTCHKTTCACDTPVVEVDVDRIWEMAHPEIYYSHFTKIGRFGNGPQPGSYYSPRFQLMRYSSNDFFKVRQLLTDCPNVDCRGCRHEFVIDMPYIEVDFTDGEILLSYLGKVLDADGEVMIPDHPDVFEALVNHLDYKWYRASWKKTKDSGDRAISQEAMQLRDLHIRMAKESLQMPEFGEFKTYLETSSFLKRLPAWQSDYVGKKTPNKALRYRRRLGY